MRIFKLALIFLIVMPIPAFSQNAGGFKAFDVDPNTPRGAHRVVNDPTGLAPMPKVHMFKVEPGPCSNRQHVSSNSSDCKFKSMRATAFEPDFRKKTDEWVSWSMYLPGNFPVGRQQAASGLYTFAYWHNTQCPHVALVSDTGNSTKLFLQTNKSDSSGKWNCIPDQRIPIADLRDLRGKWSRFELRTVFREDKRGGVELFLNGKRVVGKNMRTMSPGPTKNYFVFGLYLCCTKGTDQITPATVLFTRLSRAQDRSDLK